VSDPTAITLSGLARQYEAIAHNLANVATPGYKRIVGAFVRDGSTDGGSEGTTEETTAPTSAETVLAVDFSQGRLVRTGRSLDVALSGPGFLALETTEGERYTRNGVLRLGRNGQLVDGAGRTVAGTGGPITVPADVSTTEVTIAPDGRVLARGAVIGRLRLVEFENPAVLVPEGAGAFRAPDEARPAEAVRTTVHQGFQEASNVQAVTELVGLITATRLYQANIQVMVKSGERAEALLRIAMA